MDPNPLMPALGGANSSVQPASSPPSIERILSAIYHKLNAIEARHVQFEDELAARLSDVENAIQDLTPTRLEAVEDKLGVLQRTVEGLESTLDDVESTLSNIESSVDNL